MLTESILWVQVMNFYYFVAKVIELNMMTKLFLSYVKVWINETSRLVYAKIKAFFASNAIIIRARSKFPKDAR